MAKCTDCVHFDLCDYNTNIAGDSKIKLFYDKGAEKCSFYKPTADIVKVVRCKDCKYKKEILSINDDLELMCGFNYGLRVKGMISPFEFCSYGERKIN